MSEPTEVTTIWKDGEVYKTDRFGRTRQLANIEPPIWYRHDRIAAEHFRKKDATPRPGEVLISSPLGTQQLACGNRVPVENPTTIRVEPDFDLTAEVEL